MAWCEGASVAKLTTMALSSLRSMSIDEMDELNAELRRRFNSEAGLCMLASEPALAREWNTPEEDRAWEHLISQGE